VPPPPQKLFVTAFVMTQVGSSRKAFRPWEAAPRALKENPSCIKTSSTLCFSAMRTTITLEEDVAALLRQLRRRSNKSLKELVNAALREGLPRLMEEPKAKDRPRFRVRPLQVGKCRLPALDDVAEALAAAEGEAFR